MSDLDYSKLTDDQLLKLQAAGGDLTKLSDDDLLSIRSTLNPSFGRRVLNAAGDVAETVGKGHKAVGDYFTTQAARTAGGVLGLPGPIAKGVEWLYDQAGIDPATIVGPQGAKMLRTWSAGYPTGDDISGGMLDALNKKPVNLEGVVPGGKIIDTGVQGALGALMTGGASAPALMAGAFGGAGSEAAGQVAAEIAPGYELPARLAGAVAGGVAGAVTPSIVRKGADVASSVVEPFKEAGRELIAGRTLRKAAANADDALVGLERYQIGRDAFPDAVPGFRLDAGKASRDPGLMSVAEVAGTHRPAMRATVQANNALVTRALDSLDAGADPQAFVRELRRLDEGAATRAQAALDALPRGADAATAGEAIRSALSGRFDALRTTRRTITDPMYAAARDFPDDLPIRGLWQHLDDAIAGNKGAAQNAARRARRLLLDADGNPDWSASGMVNARTAINDMVKKAPAGTHEQNVLIGIRNEMDNAMAGVPAEQQARQTFAELSRPLDVFDAKKGATNVSSVIERHPAGRQFVMPAERVPSQFFRLGDAGGATMREFLAANDGNAGAIGAMRSFIADKAREAGDVRTFLQRHRSAIEALDPTLARQLEDAAATGSIAQGFRSSPAGRFLDGDLDAAVRSTLGAPDSARRMQTLRMAVGSSPEATAGLRRAVLDDFRQMATARVTEDATRQPMMTADGVSRWLQANRGAARNVLTPEQMGALDDIARHLRDQAQAVPGRTGSQTYDRLATESILGALVSQRYADAPILHGLKRGLGVIYGGADKAIMDIVFDAIAEPTVAAALMKKATPGNVMMAEPVLRSIGRGVAAPAAIAVERGSP